MMFADPDDGVVIAKDGSGVRLRKAGAAHEIGHPTHIDVQAGPFSGSIVVDAIWNYAESTDNSSPCMTACTGRRRSAASAVAALGSR